MLQRQRMWFFFRQRIAGDNEFKRIPETTLFQQRQRESLCFVCYATQAEAFVAQRIQSIDHAGKWHRGIAGTLIVLSLKVRHRYFQRGGSDLSHRILQSLGDQVGDATYDNKVDQERLPSAYTVDVFANKSYKINDDVFFNLTLGITNLLNANFRTGGFEQLRFDRANFDKGYNLFPPKYFYAYGTNFFLMGALRF